MLAPFSCRDPSARAFFYALHHAQKHFTRARARARVHRCTRPCARGWQTHAHARTHARTHALHTRASDHAARTQTQARYDTHTLHHPCAPADRRRAHRPRFCAALPTTTLPRRTQAIETFKESGQNYHTNLPVVEAGLHLGAAANADHLRHFGLQLLEGFVKHRWHELDDSQPAKTKVETDLLQFAAASLKPLLEEQHYILQKLAVVFVQIALREWPQRWSVSRSPRPHWPVVERGWAPSVRMLHFTRVLAWRGQGPLSVRPTSQNRGKRLRRYIVAMRTTFMLINLAALRCAMLCRPGLTDDLVVLSRHGNAAHAVSLNVLRVLIEEIDNPTSGLSNARLSDLTRGKEEVSRTIVPFIAKAVLDGADHLANTPPTPDGMVLSAESQAATHLIKAALKALAVFVNWIPLQQVLEVNLLPVLCHFLHHADLRQDSCECLILIFERTKDTVQERVPLLGVFTTIERMVASAPALGPSATDADYAYSKRLCQLLVVIGTAQLCPLWGSSEALKAKPPHFDKFVTALVSFSTHKSLMMASFTLPVWLRLLRHDLANKEVEVTDALAPLLAFCHDRLMSPLVGDTIPDPEVAYYVEADFGSTEDLKDFLGPCGGQTGCFLLAKCKAA